MLPVRPEIFHRSQFWCVGWQELQPNAASLLAHEAPNQTARWPRNPSQTTNTLPGMCRSRRERNSPTSGLRRRRQNCPSKTRAKEESGRDGALMLFDSFEGKLGWRSPRGLGPVSVASNFLVTLHAVIDHR